MTADLRHISFVGRASHAAPVPAAAPYVSSIDASDGRGADGFAAWFLSSCGLDPAAYRHAAVSRRISACLRALGAASESDAHRQLLEHPELVPAALSAMLIGVTEFFRDAAVFAAIEAAVLPGLARRPGRIRVWSAACSTGAELYTVAILLAEAGLLSRADLLGTDCRSDALARARDGIYTGAELEGVPDGLRARYVEPSDSGSSRVVREIRDVIEWRLSDVIACAPGGAWDLVMCRHLLIYLTAPAAARVTRRLVDALGPDGFLVLGRGERPAGLESVARAGSCVYQRRTHAA